MSPCFEFEGKSVEKAVQKACDELNMPREELQHDVISYGSSGIFGLVGTKKARIRVTAVYPHPVVRMPVVCSQCKDAKCAAACPTNAISSRDGIVRISDDDCVGCHACVDACPYGTIYPEHVPYLGHNCDYCLDRRGGENEPLCVKTCPHGALALKPAGEEPEPDTVLVGDNLMVHATRWEWEKA